MNVSVIIPVGDRELYKTCKQSILRSLERSDACADQWELVEVFDDAHRGAAWARTEGLRRATGDYIAWVDCDDQVTARWAAAIQQGLQSLEGESVDVLMYDVHVEWEDGRPGYDLVYGRPAGQVPADVFASDIIGVNRTGAWLWNKVFRRTLFEGKVFKGSPFEDYLMMCEVLPLANRVVYLPEVLYAYQRRLASLSQYVDRQTSAEGLSLMMAAARGRQDRWRRDMLRGVAVQMADFCRHAGGEPEFRRFLRQQLLPVLLSPKTSFRVKMKCLIETVKWS